MALTQEQSDRVKQLFDLADLDKDGFVTMDELKKEGGEQLGLPVLMMLETIVEEDGDQRLSFDELLDKAQTLKS